jgi:predicted oxidoreductase (fatty acid repression mutant protein)
MRSIKDKQLAREDSARRDHLDLAQAVPVSTETMKRCCAALVNALPETAINSQRSDIIASLNGWNQTHRREHGDFPAVWELREGNASSSLNG